MINSSGGRNVGKVSKGTDQKQLDTCDVHVRRGQEQGRGLRDLGEQCAVCRCEYDDDDCAHPAVPPRGARGSHGCCGTGVPLCQRDVGTERRVSRESAAPSLKKRLTARTRTTSTTGICQLNLSRHTSPTVSVAATVIAARVTAPPTSGVRGARRPRSAHDVRQRGGFRRRPPTTFVGRRVVVWPSSAGAARARYPSPRGPYAARHAQRRTARVRVRGRLARWVRRGATRVPDDQVSWGRRSSRVGDVVVARPK